MDLPTKVGLVSHWPGCVEHILEAPNCSYNIVFLKMSEAFQIKLKALNSMTGGMVLAGAVEM